MAEWLGNGLQNHVQQFDSAWHLDLLVISFSVINYVVSMSCPRGMRRRSFFFAYTLRLFFYSYFAAFWPEDSKNDNYNSGKLSVCVLLCLFLLNL